MASMWSGAKYYAGLFGRKCAPMECFLIFLCTRRWIIGWQETEELAWRLDRTGNIYC